MRKIKVISMAMLLMPLLPASVAAQSYNMEINLRGGTVQSIPSDEVVNVTFGETSPLPGDAGNIKATVNGIGAFLLSVEPIKNATSYRWTRDGEVVQESTATSLHTRRSGVYTVTGINDFGQGKSSPEISVNPITEVFNILTEEYIPDKNLREYIKQTYVPESDQLTNLQAAGITGDLCLPPGVETLKGIEYFVSLDSLQSYVVQTYITEADLSKNVSLKKIYLSSTFNLRELNVKGLNQLESFDISATKLRQYDLSQLPEGLKFLGIGDLRYESVDVKRFPKLETLKVYSNRIETLDLSGMKHLRKVIANTCASLSSIDLSGCTSLRELTLSSCDNLTSIDVSECPALEYLYTLWSGIGDVNLDLQRANIIRYNPQGSAIKKLDLHGMTKLQYCQAGECASLEEIPDFSDCVSLKNIRMERCQIKGDLNVNNCKNLEEINAFESKFTSLTLQDMPALWNVCVFSNPEMTSIELKDLPSLEQFMCYDLAKLERIDLSTVNHEAAIYLTSCPNLKEIKVWPDFDMDNPPANISKDATARFVYEFSN